MPVADMHQQRLRHLFSSAILDLWKKETGSVASVLIEGTVCVTVHGGRTTVVQLCDRFAGLVNDDRTQGNDASVAGGRLDGSLARSNGHLYVPAPSSAEQKNELAKDSNNNVRRQSEDSDALAQETVSVDDDSADDDDDGRLSMMIDDDKATGRPHPGAAGTSGFFTEDDAAADDDDAADDSAIQDMSLGEARFSPPSGGRVDRSPLRASATGKTPVKSNGCGGNDLLLSSPHDYTAQVRNVIRQRLLSARKSPYRAPPVPAACLDSAAGSSLSAASRPPPTPPFYRVDATPPGWLKREVPAAAAAATEAAATAARRLIASQYAAAAAAAAASGRVPISPLMSPPAVPSMSVGLPLTGVPLSATFQNFLGINPTSVGVSPSAALSSTPDSKRSTATTSDGASADSQSSSTEQKVYRCDYCYKTFLFKSKYHEHLPVHTSARPFQCHLCTRTYKYKYDLRVHLRTHLGIPTKSTVCPFCAGRFATNKFLRQHMREAHPEQNKQHAVALAASSASSSPAAAASVSAAQTSPENSDEQVPPVTDEKTAKAEDESVATDLSPVVANVAPLALESVATEAKPTESEN